MARGIDPGVAVFRAPGLYDALRVEQEAAVVKVDVRLSFDAGPDELAALTAEAHANPKRSTLLDKLRARADVIVRWSALHGRLPPDPPPWLSDPRITPCVRVTPDNAIVPADGPPDQCQY
jgi:hypothetical protein